MANIVIGITGGIAAYKAVLIARLLQKRGDSVRFILTENGEKFISPLTLQAISGYAVRREGFDEQAEQSMSHIELARWADCVLIAPASANTIAKLACGLADNLLTTICLATAAPIVLAPAMNQQMWANTVVVENLTRLKARTQYVVLPTECGVQACGDEGEGRLLAPEEIVAAVARICKTPTAQYFAGKTIVITAGATREPIDPVRFLSNRSSGKMGLALAEQALEWGAKVCLVAGAMEVPQAGFEVIQVGSALEMLAACEQVADRADIFIGAAAVSDYRVDKPLLQKHKKSQSGMLTLTLRENPDIIAQIAARKAKRPYMVGFAAETENVMVYAREKLQRKGLDLLVANEVANGAIFGADETTICLLDSNRDYPSFSGTKRAAAKHILWHIAQVLQLVEVKK